MGVKSYAISANIARPGAVTRINFRLPWTELQTGSCPDSGRKITIDMAVVTAYCQRVVQINGRNDNAHMFTYYEIALAYKCIDGKGTNWIKPLFKHLYLPNREKTQLCCLRATKRQICLRISQSDQRLPEHYSCQTCYMQNFNILASR